MASPSSPLAGKGKTRLFKFLSVLISLTMVLAAGELLFRVRERWIAHHEWLDANFMRYDPQLGWTLTPGWQGQHRHYDFSVTYTVNPDGFRADSPGNRTNAARLGVFVGDSFTFGLGVGDNETFVHGLNESNHDDRRFMNAAIPGYSTDQESLLINELIIKQTPTAIYLVVYLGNDLIDNQRGVPMQLHSPKPYYELAPTGLILRNVPVPRESPRRGQWSGEMPDFLSNGAFLHGPVLGRLVKHSRMLDWLAQNYLPARDIQMELRKQCQPALDLFSAIVNVIARQCRAKNIQFQLVLMPGRSYVESPESYSAQYQDLMRLQILEQSRGQGWRVMDLPGEMRPLYKQKPRRWFHPHDGHLNPAGHQMVAEILKTELAK